MGVLPKTSGRALNKTNAHSSFLHHPFSRGGHFCFLQVWIKRSIPHSDHCRHGGFLEKNFALQKVLCARLDASLSHSWETHGFPIPSSTGKLQFPRPPSCSLPRRRALAMLVCARLESNQEPLSYQDSVLPLNYGRNFLI